MSQHKNSLNKSSQLRSKPTYHIKMAYRMGVNPKLLIFPHWNKSHPWSQWQ